MKDTVLNLLLNEIYDRAGLAELVFKIPSLQIILEQASANDKGIPTLISAKHLKDAFDCVARIRKEKVERDTYLLPEQKRILKNAIDVDTESRLRYAKETINSHGILGE